MASSINALSYLDPSAYQTVAPSSGTTSPASGASGLATGVSATEELKAIESQGNFQAYLSSSTAVALLQQTDAGTTNSATTNSADLISHMLQQVLGAYHTQGTSASDVSTVG